MIGLEDFKINQGGVSVDPAGRTKNNKRLDDIINTDDMAAAIRVAAEADERIAHLVGRPNAADGSAG